MKRQSPAPVSSSAAAKKPAATRRPSAATTATPAVEPEDDIEYLSPPASTPDVVPPPLPPKKPRRVGGASAATTSAPTVEQRWQRGRDLIEKIFQPLKCDPSRVTLLPDAETLAALRGACQAWMNTRRQNPQLNFSSRTSFAEQMARFLLQLVLQATDELGRDVTGCAVWRQPVDFSADDQVNGPVGLRCYHGDSMVAREHIVEMSVTSEAGKRALSEQAEQAKVVQNEFGRSVVRLVYDDALICAKDARMPSGQHSSESCGLFFSDSVKMRTALAQYAAFQKACFPQMGEEAGRHLAVVLRCRCNWSAASSPKPTVQLGRQTCRPTPFQLTSASQLDAESLDDDRLRASVHFPCLLVFQCCNPSFRGGARSGGAGQCETPSCDWKLSAPDLLNAAQLAKNLWRDLLTEEPLPPLRLPELRWHQSLRYQPALLPQQVSDSHPEENASPFEMTA